jgi:hypothetical protein
MKTEPNQILGRGEGFRAVAGAVVGHEASNLDAMQCVERDDLNKSGNDAGDLFIGMDAGEAQAGVVVDGDVERLSSGAFVAIGPIAGAAHPGAHDAAELFDVEVNEFAGRVAFVADGWRRCGQQVFELV